MKNGGKGRESVYERDRQTEIERQTETTTERDRGWREGRG